VQNRVSKLYCFQKVKLSIEKIIICAHSTTQPSQFSGT
jgi:hypothetical protein